METVEEDPDSRPRRLAVLAGFGMVVATGFATIAAMAVGDQQHDPFRTPRIVAAPQLSSTWTTRTPTNGPHRSAPPPGRRPISGAAEASSTTGRTTSSGTTSPTTRERSSAPGTPAPGHPAHPTGGQDPTGTTNPEPPDPTPTSEPPTTDPPSSSTPPSSSEPSSEPRTSSQSMSTPYVPHTE